MESREEFREARGRKTPRGSDMMVSRGRFLAAITAVFLSAPAFSEEVYDFGTGLVKRFGFVDLAKAYFDGAAKDKRFTAGERLEATLGLGTVSKRLAEKESDPKAKERLYREAEKYATDFLARAGRTHPKRAIANNLKAGIQRSSARAKVQVAEGETDLLVKKQLLAEARDIYEKVVKQRSEARTATWEAFDTIEREYEETDERTQKKLKPKRDKLALQAAEAMQLYFQDKISMVKVFEEDSMARNDHVDSLVEELTEEVEEHWTAEEFKGVELSARFFLGQAYALKKDYEKAKTEGFDPVLEEDPSQYRGPGYKWIRGLQLHTYYFKAKAAFDAKEYEDAAKTAGAMLSPPRGYPDARNEDIGKAAYLLQGEAHAAREEYNEAIRAVVPVAAGTGQWVVNANKAISEYMDEAKRKKRKVQGGPMICFYSGDGHYKRALSAGEKGDSEEKERMFELAVSDLMDSIRYCRGGGTSLLSRYRYEPRCWLEMGLAYYHLELFYESALSFEAVLKSFAPYLAAAELDKVGHYDALKKRIREDLSKGTGEKPPEAVVYDGLFKELAKRPEFKAILPNLAEQVRKAANNFKVALKARKKQSRNPFDAQLYGEALRQLIKIDPKKAEEAEFYFAQTLEEEAARAKADGREKEALNAFLKAADSYLKVRKRARFYEVALFKAATSYYRVMSICARNDREKAEEFGHKALAQYQVYLDYIKSTPTTDEFLRQQRKKYSTDVRLYTPLTLFALEEYDEAIKGFEEYLVSEDKDEKYVPLMAWNRFKSYYKLAATAASGNDFSGFDKYVAEAEKLATAMIDDPAVEKYFITACNYMMAAYNRASSAAEAFKGRNDAAKKRYDGYQTSLADWMDRMRRHDPDRAKDWRFVMRTGTTFHKLGLYVRAVDAFADALKKLGEEGKRIGMDIPEEDAFWKKLKDEIMIENQKVTAELRKKMDLIRDYLFEAEGVREVLPDERKEELIDYAKALSLVIGIVGDGRQKKGGHPDIQIKKFLDKLREQLTILLAEQHIRKLTSECYPAMAVEAEKNGEKDKAREYWEKARDDFQKLGEYFWADMGLKFSLAGALAAIAGYETDAAERTKTLNDVVELYAMISIRVERDSDHYYDALVKRSHVLFDAGRWLDARKFPKLLLETEPDSVKEYFPDAAELVKQCEEKLMEAGIAFAGKKVNIEDVDYEPPSARDQKLQKRLARIGKLIELGKLKAEEKDAAVLREYKDHLGIALRLELNDLASMHRNKEISKEEYDLATRGRLRDYIYSSPFTHRGMREEAVKLGVLDEKFHGCKVELLDKESRKLAIKLGYLTEDGEKHAEAPSAPGKTE